MGAYTILNKQVFNFREEELMKIQSMWTECIEKPEIANGLNNEETFLMMKDVYEGFIKH